MTSVSLITKKKKKLFTVVLNILGGPLKVTAAEGTNLEIFFLQTLSFTEL